MKEHPILFSGPMVTAILDGHKTMTRRPLKLQPSSGLRKSPFVKSGLEDGHGREIKCPFGQVGDKLWVRETWCQASNLNDCYGKISSLCGGVDTWDYYKADNAKLPKGYKWRPSIHMPRELSRILLEIDEVRVERLQAITEDDAKAEGILDGGCCNCGNSSYPNPCGCDKPEQLFVDAFVYLWDQIYGETTNQWFYDPWVWVVKFHVVEVKGESK